MQEKQKTAKQKFVGEMKPASRCMHAQNSVQARICYSRTDATVLTTGVKMTKVLLTKSISLTTRSAFVLHFSIWVACGCTHTYLSLHTVPTDRRLL